jgi:hypothetical protein
MAEIGAGLFFFAHGVGDLSAEMEQTANSLFSNIWEEAMRRSHESGEDENTKNKNSEVRVELKYCERCGGLWVRECGTGEVYCGRCLAQIADLPIPKKKPHHVGLPVRQSSLVEDYEFKNGVDDSSDFEAAGGVA